MKRLSRRVFLGSAASAAALPSSVWAGGYVDLEWDDLLPVDQLRVPPLVRSLVPHDESNTLVSEQPASTGVRPDWNGQVVRLPGFIVPIDHRGTGVTAFLLVPYVGACIHVPPPPANQLVFVTTETPYESKGLYEPVHVVGTFGTASTYTHLAEVGYTLVADQIETYTT